MSYHLQGSASFARALPVAGLSSFSGSVPASVSGTAPKAATQISRASVTDVKTVEDGPQKDRKAALRLAKFASKRKASELLRAAGRKDAVKLSQCCYVPVGSSVDLCQNTETGAAHYRGIRTCASVWLCPICSAKISERRREELNDVLAGARSQGLSVFMVTLTARHTRRSKLATFLDALKAAKKRFQQLSGWRRFGAVGSVTATEVTFGENGPHPHFHWLILSDKPQVQAQADLEALRDDWSAALATAGLTGNHAAYDVRGASAAGEYIAKFGAAEELTLHGEKRGRKASRTPWQLLEDARDGDAEAAALWLEFAAVFKGKRQLVYSRGLKARFGIGETSDAEAAEAAENAEAQAEKLVVLRTFCGVTDWKEARRRYCAILAAAEAGTCLDAAQFGPTDSDRWRGTRAEVLHSLEVIE